MNFGETLKILEIMQKILVKKSETYSGNSGFLRAEIKALKNIMDFTNIVLNNFPKGMVQKIINSSTVNDSSMVKELINNYELINDENYENIYIDEVKIIHNYKLMYSMIKYKGKKYIILEPLQLVKDTSSWENWENFKFPMEILAENKKMIKEANIGK